VHGVRALAGRQEDENQMREWWIAIGKAGRAMVVSMTIVLYFGLMLAGQYLRSLVLP
jgi:hypothetical protein